MLTELSDNESVELELLLNAIYLKYGYDFKGYRRASIKRRVQRRLSLSGLETVSELQYKVLYDPDFFALLLQDFSVNVTEMFRDPSFFRAIREQILPELAQLDVIKIWHAGCATGEQVYSMAILLGEAGLTEKSRLYATDFDATVLAEAKEGVYSIASLKPWMQNYRAAGGLATLTDYCSAQYEFVRMDPSLKENILFSVHNLGTDSVFSEMNLIVCRNVLIYFRQDLQDRVFELFSDSLCQNGILGLGSKETIRLSRHSEEFSELVQEERLYRKRWTLSKDRITGRGGRA